MNKIFEEKIWMEIHQRKTQSNGRIDKETLNFVYLRL